MISDKTKHANSVIKNHMIWSMGAGFIPVPIADFFAVSAIQLDMIRQLSSVYDLDFKKSEGKAIITAITGSGLARMGARMVKFIPGVGSIIGGVTLAVLSGASTYALGEVFKKHFDTGGTFLDFDPSRLKKYYDDKFEKGKEMARDMQHKQEEIQETYEAAKEIDNDPIIKKLQNLAKLKDEGHLTEEEFIILKTKLLKD